MSVDRTGYSLAQFGDVVRDRRKELYLTQGDVCDAIGKQVSCWSDIEKGKRRPPDPVDREVYERLAQVLKIDCDGLIDLAARTIAYRGRPTWRSAASIPYNIPVLGAIPGQGIPAVVTRAGMSEVKGGVAQCCLVYSDRMVPVAAWQYLPEVPEALRLR